MRLRRLYRTTAARLALTYLLVFVASVTLILAFIYWNTVGFMARQTDETLAAEVTGLAEQYRARGLSGLVQIIRERSEEPGDSLYLLARPDFAPLAGNLSAWPDVQTAPGGWMDFTYERVTGRGPEMRAVRARHFTLAGSFNLLVGRDVQQRRQIEAMIRQTLFWTLIITIGLGLLGAYMFGRNALARVETINRTSRDIMLGDFARRIPTTGTGDELDQLAENLNAMLDQIERLMDGMRTVTDNIAHDLRTPLTRLRNRLEVTLMKSAREEDYRGAMEKTIEEADNLLQTFNALLSIARVEAGAQRENMGPLDPGALVQDVAELYEPVADERNITLTVTLDEPTPAGREIRGNRELISQAFANLIDNAIKYTPGGGTVAVTLTRRNDHPPRIEVSVSDSGPGIPPGSRARVLDRFVRLEESRNTPGSGLGLSLVAAVARLHEARLVLTDALPRAEAVAAEEETPGKAAPRGLKATLSFPALRVAGKG